MVLVLQDEVEKPKKGDEQEDCDDDTTDEEEGGSPQRGGRAPIAPIPATTTPRRAFLDKTPVVVLAATSAVVDTNHWAGVEHVAHSAIHGRRRGRRTQNLYEQTIC